VQNTDTSGGAAESDAASTRPGTAERLRASAARAHYCRSHKCGTGRFPFENGQGAVFSSMSAAFSAIMIDGALVLPDVSVGMIEASAIRKPVMP
jgi:hypothetical protein